MIRVLDGGLSMCKRKCIVLIPFQALLCVIFVLFSWVASATASNNTFSTEDFSELQLTKSERLWLQNHPELTYSGDKRWPPFEFVDSNGELKGIVTDFLAHIQERLNDSLRSDYRASWPETLEAMREKKIAFIPALTDTPLRREYMLFTRSYLSIQVVMLIRDGTPFVGDLRELSDEKVGVVDGYASQEYLLMNHPDLNLKFVKNAEEGLLALSNGDLDVFVTNIPSASFLVRKLGISNLKVTAVTPYTYELSMGVNPDYPQLVGILNKVIDSIPEDIFANIHRHWVSTTIEPEKNYTLVRRISVVAMIVIAVFFYWNRKLSREVNERIRSEQALRQSQEQLRMATFEAEKLARQAEAANRAKSEFLANMSHEIRTPMNAVVGYAELLSGYITDPRQKMFLESIKSGSRTLLTLINDILDLSKIEAGKLQLEYSLIDLPELFKEVQQMFASRIEQRNLEFLVELSNDLPNRVRVDETRLRQVLFNLVGNAIKFTHRGFIKVHVECVKNDSPSSDSHSSKGNSSGDFSLLDLRITVEDSGIGIPSEQQTRIFRAFEQQQGQSNRHYGGTGLGLAISKKLVEMMGGEISVQSQMGKGSCFTIILSNIEGELSDHEIEAVVENEGLHYQFSPSKVLVVDDIEVNRTLVREMLEPVGLQIQEAENGETSVVIAQQWLPDLVLMDIRMPVMDGYDALASLRWHNTTRDIPVIALTASVMSSDEDRIHAAGFDGYLKKPIGYDELLAELGKYLPHVVEGALPEVGRKDVQGHGEECFDVHTMGLLEQLMPQVQALKDSGDIAALEQFSQELNMLAQQAQIKPLTQYSHHLHEAIELFDLDRVHQLVAEFPFWLARHQQGG